MKLSDSDWDSETENDGVKVAEKENDPDREKLAEEDAESEAVVL